MFEVSFLGFKYTRRILSEELSEQKIQELKNAFSYIQLGSYKSLSLPGFTELTKKAVIIDLAPDIQQIFSTFKDNTRNEINRTYKIDGLRFVSLDANFNALHVLHRNFDLQRGWMPAPKAELKKSLIFTAYLNDKPISVITCFNNDTTLRILELFSARYNTNEKEYTAIVGYATRRLVYEVCKFGKEHGFSTFDLGGINLDDPAKAGVAKFKQSFGGTITDVYFYLYTTPAFAVLKKIVKLFKIDIPA